MATFEPQHVAAFRVQFEDCAIDSAGEYLPSVRGDVDCRHVGVQIDGPGLGTGLEIPHPQRAVLAAGNAPSAIGDDGHIEDPSIVAFQEVDLLPALRIPETDRFVSACGEDPALVCRDAHGRDLATMFFNGLDRLTRGKIPDNNRFVGAPGDTDRCVRADGYSVDPCLVLIEVIEHVAREGIPHSHTTIASAAYQASAVVRHVQRGHRGAVCIYRPEQPTFGQVPHPDAAVGAAGCHIRAVCGHGVDPRAGSLKPPDGCAIVRPERDPVVASARQGDAPVGIDNDGAHGLTHGNGGGRAALPDVPHLEHTVPAAGYDGPAVGGKGHGLYGLLVPRGRPDGDARRQVPEPYGTVFASGGRETGARSSSDATDRAVVPGKFGDGCIAAE